VAGACKRWTNRSTKTNIRDKDQTHVLTKRVGGKGGLKPLFLKMGSGDENSLCVGEDQFWQHKRGGSLKKIRTIMSGRGECFLVKKGGGHRKGGLKEKNLVKAIPPIK